MGANDCFGVQRLREGRWVFIEYASWWEYADCGNYGVLVQFESKDKATTMAEYLVQQFPWIQFRVVGPVTGDMATNYTRKKGWRL